MMNIYLTENNARNNYNRIRKPSKNIIIIGKNLNEQKINER